MPASDSSPDVALSPPALAPLGLPGRPPPLRRNQEAAEAFGNAPATSNSDAAALWDAPPELVDFDMEGPEETRVGGAPPVPESDLTGKSATDAPKIAKPASRATTGASTAVPNAASTPSSSPPVQPPPPSKPAAPAEQAPASLDDTDEEDDESDELVIPARRFRGLRGAAAFFTSMTVHMAGLIAMALIVVALPEDHTPVVFVIDPRPEPDEHMDTLELDTRDSAAAQFTASGSLSSANVSSAELTIGAPGSKLGIVGEPALDQAVVAQTEAQSDIVVAPALAFAPSKERLVAATPDGLLGDPRAVVDGYDEAFDRITQEILWMLSKRDVLVTWCFDQSESMKDDQVEIRNRVDRVYTELGLATSSKGDHLLSAVTSYGQGFLIHTPNPTNNYNDLRTAIESVPVDPSGKEMMCQAVMASIARFHQLANKQNRQMALILVTDESGERDNNVQYLEGALAAAKTADCRIYVLGRESVFGYPFAHMRWVHPQTRHEHWISIDRGPETAFVEQLQTEGFRRRYDSFNSGFGPYEQTRLARESGGVFFMLPSTETKLVRDSEKRRYELDAMRSYRPDLRARNELLVERDRSPLRAMLSRIIYDLDPYRPEVAEIMEVSFNFPPHVPQFLPAAIKEQDKAKKYLAYLDRVTKILDANRRHREQESSPRWQANFDLVYAQLIAYTARTYEYGAMFDHFVAKPKVVPLMKPGHMELAGWQVRHSTRTVGGDLSKAYIDRSAAMFRKLIADYPGTPWAARAQWELDRGFGFELHEYYHYTGPRPPTPTTPSVPLIPVPNL